MSSASASRPRQRAHLRRRAGAARFLVAAASWSAALLVLCNPFPPVLAAPGSAAAAPGPGPAATAQPPVRIEGNRALAAPALREAAAVELERFSRPGGGRADADDAAFRMILAYRKAGYAFAEVGYRIAAGGEARSLVFTITEGPRVYLGPVGIEGAAAFPVERLRGFFSGPDGLAGSGGPAPFVEAEVRAAVDELRDYYLAEGFLDVAIAGPRFEFKAFRTLAFVTLQITEGPRYLVRAATFSGDLEPEAAAGLRQLGREVIGEVFTGLVDLTVRGRVADLYGDLGFPDAGVQVRREAGEAPGDVLLRTQISSGPRVRIAAVSVSGNERTRESFILRRVPLAAGDWYNLSKVEAAVRELYGTGLFSRVDIRLEDGAGAAERTLGVAVEEIPARELSLSVGWSSYERIRAGAGVRHLNLFGTGRSAGLEGHLSTKRTNVTADLADPRFLGTRFVASLPVGYRRDEEPAFTLRQVEIAPQLAWQISRNFAATARYPLQYAWTGSFSDEAPPELATENYRLARLGLQLRYDTRRGLFFPTRGLEATLSGDVADPALGSQLNFLRLVGTLRGYVPLSGSTVLALRGESGIVVPTRGAADIPLGERFFLGGERSVRSFQESRLGPQDAAGEPVGGLAFTLLGAELRQRISGNLSGALFADLGNIAPNRSFPALAAAAAAGTRGDRDVIDATRRDFFRDYRAGLGVGLRYLLPIGPARLDLAWNPDPRAGEEKFVSQLSVGMAF